MRCHDLVGDLFPHVSALLVERVFVECGVVRLVARTQSVGVACPACAAVSSRVHSVYERRLEDTPVGERQVVIELTVRRLYCENSACSRSTFAEQVEGLTIRYGRRTPASRRLLEAVAIALAGRARGQTPDSEKRLRRQVRKLKELRAADAEEIAQLKTDVEALVGTLHQSMTENRLLRQQLADRTGTVRMLPTQSHIGDTTHPLPSDLMPSSDC